MFLLKTSAAIVNPNAPIYESDPVAEALLALGPTLWLEADTRFVVTSGSSIDAWVDRVSGRRMLPAGAAKATLTPAGSKSAVRMLNSPMAPELGFETFTADGAHTIAVLFRITTAGAEVPSPGGYLVGSNGGIYNYMNAIRPGTGGLDLATGEVAINGSATDFRDGAWHLLVLSVPSTPGTPTISKLFIDGVEDQAYESLKPPPIAGNRQLLLGGGGAAGANLPLTGGYIGGVMYIPGKAIHTNSGQLATLHDYWLARRSERSA